MILATANQVYQVNNSSLEYFRLTWDKAPSLSLLKKNPEKIIEFVERISAESNNFE